MSDELSNPTAPPEVRSVPEIKSVEPGVEKTLELLPVRDTPDSPVDDDKVRLRITNTKGDHEAIVVLYGDINMALTVLGHNPAQAGGGGVPIDGPIGEPTNEGENLERTPSNPELDPHQPGVEPEDAPVNSGPNAPATTDPEGDTAKQNAPEVTAPEPDGPNVTTNPGTDSTSDAQTEVPQPAEPTPEPQPTIPAENASDKPLYVYVGEGDYAWPDGYTASGLQTPDDRPLYHYDADVADQPAAGAIDGVVGIYADEVVAPAPDAS